LTSTAIPGSRPASKTFETHAVGLRPAHVLSGRLPASELSSRQGRLARQAARSARRRSHGQRVYGRLHIPVPETRRSLPVSSRSAHDHGETSAATGARPRALTCSGVRGRSRTDRPLLAPTSSSAHPRRPAARSGPGAAPLPSGGERARVDRILAPRASSSARCDEPLTRLDWRRDKQLVQPQSRAVLALLRRQRPAIRSGSKRDVWIVLLPPLRFSGTTLASPRALSPSSCRAGFSRSLAGVAAGPSVAWTLLPPTRTGLLADVSITVLASRRSLARRRSALGSQSTDAANSPRILVGAWYNAPRAPRPLRYGSTLDNASSGRTPPARSFLAGAEAQSGKCSRRVVLKPGHQWSQLLSGGWFFCALRSAHHLDSNTRQGSPRPPPHPSVHVPGVPA